MFIFKIQKFWYVINFELNKEMFEAKNSFSKSEQEEIEYSYNESIRNLSKQKPIMVIIILFFNVLNFFWLLKSGFLLFSSSLNLSKFEMVVWGFVPLFDAFIELYMSKIYLECFIKFSQYFQHNLLSIWKRAFKIIFYSSLLPLSILRCAIRIASFFNFVILSGDDFD